MRTGRPSLPALILMTFACAGVFSNSVDARELRDSTDSQVKLVDHPARIVTLAPNLGEIVAGISANDLGRIVGVSEFTDYPAELTKTASVGPYAKFNLERVLELKPDLVLAIWNGNPKDQVEHLRELGVPVVVVKTDHLSEIPSAIRLIGEAMGNGQAAEKIAAGLERSFAEIAARARSRGALHPRVLLQLDSEPLVVAGGSSFLNDSLSEIGARNLYGDLKTQYPRPALEDAVQRNPDVVIFLGMAGSQSNQESVREYWGRFAGISAVKSGKVRFLASDEIVRPSPRIVEGLKQLEKAVYGD